MMKACKTCSFSPVGQPVLQHLLGRTIPSKIAMVMGSLTGFVLYTKRSNISSVHLCSLAAACTAKGRLLTEELKFNVCISFTQRSHNSEEGSFRSLQRAIGSLQGKKIKEKDLESLGKAASGIQSIDKGWSGKCTTPIPLVPIPG